MLFSLFLNALMLLDETVSTSRAFQRCEKKYFLTFFISAYFYLSFIFAEEKSFWFCFTKE